MAQNRLVILEGLAGPFGAYRRKRRKAKRSGGRRGQQSKMKACAGKWRKSGKHGKYTAFMKKCLKK